MKRLSKEKRNQLVVVAIVTLGLLGLIYVFMIQPQYRSLSNIARDKAAADKKLQGIKQTITNANVTANALIESSSMLARTEQDMASGDLYSWTYDTLRRFKQPYKVEIPEIGHPAISEVDLLPSFPYKQIRFSISGTGYYHDLGKFIADFENTFPHGRVVHLIVESISSPDGTSEKLTFRMDIVALVKLNAS